MAKRPVAIWSLALANGVLAAFLIGASLVAEEHGYQPWQAAISGLCGIGITLSAHATWYGYRLGRTGLLALLTLFLGLMVVQSAAVLVWALQTGYQGPLAAAAFTRLLLSLIWLLVNYGFLLGKRMRSFFG